MNEDTIANIATLRRGIEENNAALVISLYAEDAEMRIIDRLHPPSAPLDLHGKAAIAAFYDDVCGRAMTHKVGQEVVAENRWAFTEACEYPNGGRVFCSAVLDLRGGKIVRQTNVQAWDE